MLTCVGLERFLSIDLVRRRRNKNKKIYRSPIVPLVSSGTSSSTKSKRKKREDEGERERLKKKNTWRRLRRRRRGVIARALHATRVSNRVNMYRTKGEEEDDSRSECGFIHLLLASFPFRPKEEEKVK